MTAKVSKALEEVWEWKEAVYQETKHMTTRERLEYIKKEIDEMLEEEGVEKVWLSKRVYILRRKEAPRSVVAEEKEEYGREE